jgi:hypothetical protein
MHTHLEFIRKYCIHHPMPLDAGFALEAWSYDLYPEMAFALRVGAGMAMVLMRFVDNFERSGRKRLRQLTRQILTYWAERHLI